MRKYICIIFSITILACARDVSKTKSEASENVAAESDYEFMIEMNDEEAKDIIEDLETEAAMDIKSDEGDSSLSFERFSSQKLKEYFDLIQLKQQHPEFKNDIILQLQKFSTDTTIGQGYTESFKIENIRLAERLDNESNASQKLKLYFDVIQENSKQKDSIVATIFQKIIMVDNKEITSNKITFSKVSN